MSSYVRNGSNSYVIKSRGGGGLSGYYKNQNTGNGNFSVLAGNGIGSELDI